MLTLERASYADSVFNLSASFRLEAGSLCAVLGPSGAGKTTLLNMIAGFVPLASGTITVSGQDISQLPPAARPVSMVFQDNNVFPHLSVEQNVGLGLSTKLKLTAPQREQVAAALARVGLSTLASRKPGDISGGERQRVALARVWLRNRPVLLLDEPFAALDPGLRRDMLSLVAAITAERKLVTLLVSHQPFEVSQQTQTAIFVSDGVARPPLSMAKFLGSRGDKAVAAYLGSSKLPFDP